MYIYCAEWFHIFCRYNRLETDVGALLWQTLGTIEYRFYQVAFY